MKKLYKINDTYYIDFDNDISFFRVSRCVYGTDPEIWWEYIKHRKMCSSIIITDRINFNTSNRQEKWKESQNMFLNFVIKLGYYEAIE